MGRPSLSIVIPCLNEASEIATTLDALSGARARGVEIVVVDGGSSDATVKLAEAGADVVISSSPGRARQMNVGAANTSGGVVLFLHADTRLPSESDILLLERVRTSCRRWGRFDVTITGRSPLLRVIATMMNWRSRCTGIATGDQAIFVARDLFDVVGGFPEVALMEDVALTARLRRYAPPLCLRARVLTSGRRWEQHGVVRTVLLMWRLRLAYWCGASPQYLAKRYEAGKSA